MFKDLIPQTISFEEIRDVWLKNLWPDRKSILKPVSRVDIDGNINMQMTLGEPKFVCFKDNSTILAVASGHQTDDLYRMRGLWVDSRFRRQGIGTQLFSFLQKFAIKENKTRACWIMARSNNKLFYEGIGFSVHIVSNQYEYGPHYFMIRTHSDYEIYSARKSL